jgi:hypothetical protein
MRSWEFGIGKSHPTQKRGGEKGKRGKGDRAEKPPYFPSAPFLLFSFSGQGGGSVELVG